MSKANTAFDEVFADLFVLLTVETVVFEKFIERVCFSFLFGHTGDESVDDGLDRGVEGGIGSASMRKLIEFGASGERELGRRFAEGVT